MIWNGKKSFNITSNFSLWKYEWRPKTTSLNLLQPYILHNCPPSRCLLSTCKFHMDHFICLTRLICVLRKTSVSSCNEGDSYETEMLANVMYSKEHCAICFFCGHHKEAIFERHLYSHNRALLVMPEVVRPALVICCGNNDYIKFAARIWLNLYSHEERSW